MKRNSRLSLAFHALVHMAATPERVRASAEIASHAHTNPVVVRRVLGKLREAGILHSEKGASGGWRLARDAAQITLADVYLALGESLVAPASDDAHADCALENALHDRVSRVMQEVEETLIARLRETSIIDIRSEGQTGG